MAFEVLSMVVGGTERRNATVILAQGPGRNATGMPAQGLQCDCHAGPRVVMRLSCRPKGWGGALALWALVHVAARFVCAIRSDV